MSGCTAATYIGAAGVGLSAAGDLGAFGSAGQGAPAQGNSVNSLPSWLSTPYQQNAQTAQTLAQTPYNPAMNYQVAGFNPQQTQAFAGIGALQGQYQQPYQQAQTNTQQLGNQATSGLNNSQFQSYMNPYIQQVNQASNAQSFQNLGIAQNQLGEQAAGSGAFGNDRVGLAQGQLSSNALMNMNAQNASNLAGGFNTALGGYQTGINQGLNAANQMGSLASGQQTAGLQGLSALQASGQTQQALQQSQYTASQQNALQQAQYPWQQLTNEQSVLSPMASAYGINSSTQTLQQPSALSQLGSTALGAYGTGLFNSFGSSSGSTVPTYASQSDGSGLQQSAGGYTYDGGTVDYNNGQVNYRQGGIVGYAKGGGVSANTMPGAPAFFHQMSKYTPHFQNGRAGFRTGGIAGFAKGGMVDPSHLQHGMRTGGVLHKPVHAKAGKAHMASPETLAGLAALAQQYGGQPGPAGSTPSQGLPNPSMSGIAAPGAQQPQIGLASGGMVPRAIRGYDGGGSVDPLAQALTNPGNNYSLGDIIQEQRANNYINQLLGQSGSGLASGYRKGGIVGYDGGGSPPGYVPNQYGTMIPDPNGNPMSYTQNGSAYQFTPYSADQTPLQRMQAVEGNAGQILNPMRAAQGLYNTVSGAGGAISNYLNTPMNQTNPQDAAATKATQQMAKVAAIQAAKAKANTSAGITPEDEAYADQLNHIANATQQPPEQPQQQQGQQGPIGPYGTPMNLPALAMSSGMLAGYAGHGNSAADTAAGYGAVVNQAMQQRQNDSNWAYRNAMAQAGQMRAGADVQRANNQTADQPWKQALQQAQTQNTGQATAAKLSDYVLTRSTALQNTINNNTHNMYTATEAHQQATLEAMQSMQQMQSQGGQQQPQGMFGQQGMGQLPPGFIRNQ